jgi:hypothetical protein
MSNGTIFSESNRVAVLWLKDGNTFHEIPDSDWPSVTHGDDKRAAIEWSKLTGLQVTIRTTVQTTYKEEDS